MAAEWRLKALDTTTLGKVFDFEKRPGNRGPAVRAHRILLNTVQRSPNAANASECNANAVQYSPVCSALFNLKPLNAFPDVDTAVGNEMHG